jgi:hypothetical protein
MAKALTLTLDSSNSLRKRRFSMRHSGHVLSGRNKRTIQRAAWQTTRRQEKQTIDAASGAAGKASARERNERFSERRVV